MPIYERHAELTKLETALDDRRVGERRPQRARALALRLRGLPRQLRQRGGGEDRRGRDEDASRSATRTIPYRDLRPRIANADDRARRERARARAQRGDRGAQRRSTSASTRSCTARPSGSASPNYTELYRGFEYPLDDLADQCRRFLDSTERLWEDAGDRFFRSRIGLGLGEIERWDVARVWRGVTWDSAFPKERMLPALEATLADLGVDLRAQRNVELDLEDRPNKTPRAFCVPIEIPERVILVIKPQGGPDDWRALFHEAGHTEHFAHTSPSLTVEERRLGDNAVTEGWAMLLEHLTIDPAWLDAAARLPAPARVRGRGRDAAALAAAPLLREAALRDRVPRRAGRDDDAVRATSSCSATR